MAGYLKDQTLKKRHSELTLDAAYCFYKISGITSKSSTLDSALDQLISWDLKFYHVRFNFGVVGGKTLYAVRIHRLLANPLE